MALSISLFGERVLHILLLSNVLLYGRFFLDSWLVCHERCLRAAQHGDRPGGIFS